MCKFVIMEDESKKSTQLDKLILEALEQQPDEAMSPDFSSLVVSRWERKVALGELLTEFGMKTALVIASLAVLTGFLFLALKDAFPTYLRLAADHWQMILGSTFIILITFFIDQVLLRYFSDTR